MRTTIILARHGETEWNRLRLAQGKSDIPLSEFGIAQTKALAKKLQHLGITHIYSSKLKRASQTARIVAQALSLSFEEHEGFNERDLGPFEGSSWDENNKRFPGGGEEFIVSKIEGGEPHNMFFKRVTDALENVLVKHAGEMVLIVCHGGVLFTLVKHLKKIPHKQYVGFKFPNTSLSIFHVEGKAITEEVIADASHLEILN